MKTFLEMIQVDLEMSTGDRLLLAAGIIEAHPENHNQDIWVSERDPEGTYHDLIANPENVTNHEVEIGCGTAFCAAGLGVVLTPPELIAPTWNWWQAGSVAFGLDMPRNAGGWIVTPVADQLFHSENLRARVVEAMRYLAGLDEGERTIEAFEAQGFDHAWFTGENE